MEVDPADPAVDRGIHPAVAQLDLGVPDGRPGRAHGMASAAKDARSRSRTLPGRGWAWSASTWASFFLRVASVWSISSRVPAFLPNQVA